MSVFAAWTAGDWLLAALAVLAGTALGNAVAYGLAWLCGWLPHQDR